MNTLAFRRDTCRGYCRAGRSRRNHRAATPEKRKLENAAHRTWQLERLAEAMLSEFGARLSATFRFSEPDRSTPPTSKTMLQLLRNRALKLCSQP